MPTEQHTAEMHPVRAALVRGATPVCADTRIAGHVVVPDSVAAASALPDLTVSGAARGDALRRAGTRQLPDADDDAVEPDGGTGELCDVLGRFRASGGSVRFAASGPEQQLSPQCRAAVRSVSGRVQTGAAEAVALSVTLTWSPQPLDLLVVLVPSHGARTACLDGDDLEGPSHLAHPAGGTIRLGTPRCGGSVLAVVLPVLGLPGARIGR